MYSDSDIQKEEVASCTVKDIFHLNDQEKDILRERVRQSDRSIDVLVHPFYRESDPEAQRGPTTEYLKRRDEFIHDSFHPYSRVSLIFEEIHTIPNLRSRLQNETGALLIVPTHPEKPRPHLRNDSGEVYDDQLSWAIFSELLGELGIKKVTVGGRYLNFGALEDSEGIPNIDQLSRLSELKALAQDKPDALQWLTDDLLPYGCAGIAAQRLIENGFDVSLSNVSSPDVYDPK